jgi:hypothetical protein
METSYNVKMIEKFRKEYLGIDDGPESTPSIDASNWINLHPIYIIDITGGSSVLADGRAATPTPTFKLKFLQQPVLESVNMYYMFLGYHGCHITSTQYSETY